MKKSMLTLVGCALAASTVMAAAVDGNNTAVVIQKEPVVSSNLYQFLIVPVKGFDITGNAESSKPIALNEILPPTVYEQGTLLYKALDSIKMYTVSSKKTWVELDDIDETDVGATTFFNAKDVLWLQSPADEMLEDDDAFNNFVAAIPDTVFCGQISTTEFAVDVTDEAAMIPIGNATSVEQVIRDIKVYTVDPETKERTLVGPRSGDAMFVLKAGESEYDYYHYNATGKGSWKKEGTGIWMVEMDGSEKLPAGGAAYYRRVAAPTQGN